MQYYRVGLLRVVTLGLMLVLGSCAGLFNGKTQSILLKTPGNAKIISGTDTTVTAKNRSYITVARGSKPLKFVTVHDSLATVTTIKSRPSFMYLANISNYGIGFLIDRKNPKRYAYPSTIDLTQGEKKPEIQKNGRMYLAAGIPYVNNFLMRPDGYGRKNNTGFLGLSVGADYYYKENNFVNITFDAATDFELPFIAPLDYFSDYEFMSSLGMSLSNNHVYNRFSFGYGLSFRRNTWELRRYDSPLPDIKVSSNSLGLNLNSYYRLGRTIHVGVNYMPTMINFQPVGHLEYEHVVSLTFLWKFRL